MAIGGAVVDSTRARLGVVGAIESGDSCSCNCMSCDLSLLRGDTIILCGDSTCPRGLDCGVSIVVLSRDVLSVERNVVCILVYILVDPVWRLHYASLRDALQWRKVHVKQ